MNFHFSTLQTCQERTMLLCVYALQYHSVITYCAMCQKNFCYFCIVSRDFNIEPSVKFIFLQKLTKCSRLVQVFISVLSILPFFYVVYKQNLILKFIISLFFKLTSILGGECCLGLFHGGDAGADQHPFR